MKGNKFDYFERISFILIMFILIVQAVSASSYIGDISGLDGNNYVMGQAALGEGFGHSFGYELGSDDIGYLQTSEISFNGLNHAVEEKLQLARYGFEPAAVTSLGSDDDYRRDVFFELGKDAIRYAYQFEDDIDLTSISSWNPLTIRFLNTTIRIVGVQDTQFDALIGDDFVLKINEAKDVNGKSVKLVNVNDGSTAVVEVDGVFGIVHIGLPIAVNGIEVALLSTSTADMSASLIAGDDVLIVFRDGYSYIGEDEDDPNWVWDIAELTQPGPSVYKEELLGGDGSTQAKVLRIENDFTWNDNTDKPAGVGDCVSLPNDYANICFDSLNVADENYGEYSFEFEDSVDLPNVLGDGFSTLPTVHVYTSIDDGIELPTYVGANDLNNEATSVKAKDVWMYYNAAGSVSGNISADGYIDVFYEDEVTNEIKWHGSVSEANGTILAVNYGNTIGTGEDGMVRLLKDNISSDAVEFRLDAKESAEDNSVWYYANDLKIKFGLSEGRFNSLGQTASLSESNELMAKHPCWNQYSCENNDGWAEIGSKDEDHRNAYGIIINNPSEQSLDDRVSLLIPNEQVIANIVIGNKDLIEPQEDNTEDSPSLWDSFHFYSPLIKILPLGKGLSNTTYFDASLQDDDIGGFFDGEITFNGAAYDTSEELQFGNTDRLEPYVATSLMSDMDYHTDVFFETSRDMIRYAYKFDEDIDLTKANIASPVTINFLGNELKIASVLDNQISVLNGTEYFMNLGDTILVDGKTVTLTNVSGGSAVISVDGVSQTVYPSGIQTVNGIDVYTSSFFVASNQGTSSVHIYLGAPLLKTYQDRDAFIGEDNDNPNWVWDIQNMLATGASAYAENPQGGASPAVKVLRVENNFAWSDDSDEPASVGDCISLPNDYAVICLGQLSVAETDYADYNFEFDNSADFSSLFGSEYSQVPAIHVYTSVNGGIELPAYENVNDCNIPPSPDGNYNMNTGDIVTVNCKNVKLIDVGSASVVVEVDGTSQIVTTSSPQIVNGIEVTVIAVFSRTERADSSAVLSLVSINDVIQNETASVTAKDVWLYYNAVGSVSGNISADGYIDVFYKDEISNEIKWHGSVNQVGGTILAVNHGNTNGSGENGNVKLLKDEILADYVKLKLDINGDSNNYLNDGFDDMTMQWWLNKGRFDSLGLLPNSAEREELTWDQNPLGVQIENQRTVYGIIVKSPAEQSLNDRVSLSIPNDQVLVPVMIADKSWLGHIESPNVVLLNSHISEYPSEYDEGPIKLGIIAADNKDESLICDIYMDNAINLSSVSFEKGLLKEIAIDNIQDGEHSVYVSCTDSDGLKSDSSPWIFNVNLPVEDNNSSGNQSTPAPASPSPSGGSGGGGGGGGSSKPLSRQVSSISNIEAGESVRFEVDSSKIPVTYLEIKFIGSESLFKITVEALDSKPSDLSSPSDNVIKYLAITPNVGSSGNIDFASIDFELSSNDLGSIRPEDVVLFRYNNGKWGELDTDYLGSANGKYKFKSFTPGFSYFAIGEKKKAIEKQKPEEEMIVLGPALPDTFAESEDNVVAESQAITGKAMQDVEDNNPIFGKYLFLVILAVALCVLVAVWAYKRR